MENNIYKTALKVIPSSEGARCNYPFRIDPYFGCEHNCCYCYSKVMNETRKNTENFAKNFKYANLEKIEIIFRNALKTESQKILSQKDPYKNPTIYINNKIPVRIGAGTDPLQPIEKVHKLTYKLIEFLNKINYPYIIVTKSDLIANDEYLKILRKDLAYIQISITTLNSELSSQIEPGAPLPSSRLSALKKLSDHGFKVAARISPLIPIYKDSYYSSNNISNEPNCKYFSFELIEEVCKTNPTTLIVEFLRVSQQMLNNFKLLQMPLDNFFTSNFENNYKQFSLAEKKEYFKKIKNICESFNIQFTVCDDNNFEELTEFWNDPCDCCNACKNLPVFKTKASLPTKN